jgi:alcohol dehydrogenase class IV
VVGEPSVSVAEDALQRAREHAANAVIGIGGGSALDVAKAVAGLLTNDGELVDYLEVVGKGRPLAKRAAPMIAIPTTAGTGSEATRNAVLEVSEKGVKVSMRSPLLIPAWAIVDPELTLDLPPGPTATSGFDALAQLLESFVSVKANAFTDALCREALPRVGRSLRTVCLNGRDLSARSDMALAALFSGMALANGGLGAVHGLAGPLGGMLHAPHGALCATLLAPAIEVNVQALRSRAPDSPALARYDEAARLVTGKAQATVTDLLSWIQTLASEVRIPRLCQLGLLKSQHPQVVERSQAASSMKGNPITLFDEEIVQILDLAG